jgi:hypothetical protein
MPLYITELGDCAYILINVSFEINGINIAINIKIKSKVVPVLNELSTTP